MCLFIYMKSFEIWNYLLEITTNFHYFCVAFFQDLERGEQANWEQNVNDAIAVFHKLQTGLDVNVRFTGWVHGGSFGQLVFYSLFLNPWERFAKNIVWLGNIVCQCDMCHENLQLVINSRGWIKYVLLAWVLMDMAGQI